MQASSKKNRRSDRLAVIGYRIRRRRLVVGMSQRGLAAAVGVHERTLRTWEQGKNALPVDMLHDLAAALRCQPLELLG